MPLDGNPGRFPRWSQDTRGPRWMVVLGLCLFAIGVICAL